MSDSLKLDRLFDRFFGEAYVNVCAESSCTIHHSRRRHRHRCNDKSVPVHTGTAVAPKQPSPFFVQKQHDNAAATVKLYCATPLAHFLFFDITLSPNITFTKQVIHHITMSSSSASPRSPGATAARSTTTSVSYRQYTRAGSSATENLPPRTLARVAREVRELHKNPPENVRLVVDPATGMPNNLGELMVRTV